MHALTLAIVLGACLMPAQQTQRYGVGGLITNPNPQLKAKDGALMRADEVVLRRPGMVEPRPGFSRSVQVSDGGSNALDEVFALLPFDNALLVVGDDGGTTKTLWQGQPSPATHVTTDGSTNLPWTRGAIRCVEARKNAYLTTADAIRKMSASTDVEAPRASTPSVLLDPASSASTGPIADGYKVAYRALIRSKDSNGLIVRGAPSGRAIFSAVGSDRTVTLDVIFLTLDPPLEGSTIELYRTLNKPNTLPTVPDELRLAQEHEITAADLAAGYVSIVDDREDDDLGKQLPLYTSPSREGIERTNIRAPLAKDIALFQGSLFAANIKFPHYVQFTWDEGVGVGATGIGTRPVTGDVTNSSAQIINVSDTTGLQVGQLLDTATFSWAGTGPVRITSIVGSTVTVSEQWTGANTPGLAITFVDSLRIGSDYFPVLNGYTLVETISSAASSGLDYRTVESSDVIASLISDGPVRTPSGYSTGNRRVVRIERPDPSLGSFEVWATHGDEYDPPLPLPTEANGLESTQDDFPNGLTWSKGDQPEHFMLDRKFLVGNQRSPILRIMEAGEALWILKGHGDGIYQLTGFGERTGWSIVKRSDLYLLHPDLAVADEDAIYAWTNKGLVSITDAGVGEPMSGSIADLTSDLERTLVHDAEAAEDMPHAFAVSSGEEVIFGLPPVDFDDTRQPVDQTLVMHVAGGRWSKWFANSEALSCAALDPATRLLVFGMQDEGRTRNEKASTHTYRNSDREFGIIITSSVSGTTVTIPGASGWTPAVGDMIVNGTNQRGVVVSVASATVFDIHITGFVSGAIVAYEGVAARVQWHPEIGPGGGVAKRFHSNVLHWDDTFGVQRWSVILETSTNPGDEVTQTYTREWARESKRDDTRAMFTREISYANQLYQTLYVRQADSRWRVSGLSTNLTPTSVRVSR